MSNSKLQADWSSFGEESFEISVYAYGDFYTSELERVKLVNQLIAQNVMQNKPLYNQRYSSLDPADVIPVTSTVPNAILSTGAPVPKQVFVQGNQNLTFQPPLDQFPKAKPIYLADRKPIFADGRIFLSIKEAATFFKVNWNVVQEKIHNSNPNYREATHDEIYQELVRRGWSTVLVESPGPVVGARTTKGVSRAIVVENKLYPTIAAAARAYGVDPNSVRKWPKTGHNQSYFLKDYPNGHPNPSWAPTNH
jgi:hypothetical protein